MEKLIIGIIVSVVVILSIRSIYLKLTGKKTGCCNQTDCHHSNGSCCKDHKTDDN